MGAGGQLSGGFPRLELLGQRPSLSNAELARGAFVARQSLILMGTSSDLQTTRRRNSSVMWSDLESRLVDRLLGTSRCPRRERRPGKLRGRRCARAAPR